MIKKRRSFLILIVGLTVFNFSHWSEASAGQSIPGGSSTSGQRPQPPVSAKVPSRMPDLELTSIWTTDQCLPRIKVTNTGETVIKSDVNCRLHYLVDGGIFLISSCTYKDLNPGESFTHEYGVASRFKGHKIKAIVDATNVVAEKNEGNNSKEVLVNTCGQPNFPYQPMQINK